MGTIAFGKVSDLLSTERERPFKIGWELGEQLDGSVELIVGNVFPGEPIGVRWRVVLGLRGTDSTSYSIRLLIDGQLVHERAGIPAGQASVGGAVLALWGEQSFQTESVVIGDANAARLVYRIGAKTLSAEVRGPGSAVPEFVGSVRFRVVREPFDSSWWEWRVPAFESIEWKTAYTLVGDFVNRSRFASMSLVNAELSEVRSEENPEINPCDYHPIQVQSRNFIAAGGRSGFSFGLMQDWQWFIPAAYVVKGPINKTFAYAVFLSIIDEFGNVYDGVCSARRIRHVGVPKEKRLAAVAAQTAASNAALWATMLTWAVSAAWYGVAVFNGEIAKDPPDPDSRFREPVDVIPLPLPRWSADASTRSFRATTCLLETAAHLAALEKARTVSRARMLGARLEGDGAALKLQQGGYLEIERRMTEASAKLGEILPAVQKEVDGEPRLDPKNFEPLLRELAREGLPEKSRKAMLKGGVRLAEINALSTLVRDHEVVELARANGLFLVPFVLSLQLFVLEVQDDRERILGGETYVQAPGRDGRGLEVDVPDLEAVLRPRRAWCC